MDTKNKSITEEMNSRITSIADIHLPELFKGSIYSDEVFLKMCVNHALQAAYMAGRNDGIDKMMEMIK